MFDLIVIGSGPGGYVAAIRASQLGLKTAIIEKDNLGGICLNWGCIPTKSLIKSAKVFNYLKNSYKYGFKIKNIEINFNKIIDRSRKISNKMNQGIDFLMKKNNIKVIFGNAILKKNKKVIVYNNKLNSSKEYSASNIIIATGSKPKTIPNINNDGIKIINYKQALSLEKLPNSIVIIGSGSIGVEFASFYNSLGVTVSIIEKLPNIMSNEDEEISKKLESILKNNGINIYTSSKIDSINIMDEYIILKIKDKEIIKTDIILSAIGVKPNTNNIGLEDLGINKNINGKINVNNFYETNISGYYAIGDIVKGPALAHKASADAIICVENIKGLNPIPMDYNNIPICTYSIPEVASVGYTEKKAKEKGYDINIGRYSLKNSGKAIIDDNENGLIKVIIDNKYGEWLGCHMIGNGVTDIISEIVSAKKLETTATDIIKTIHPHPSLSETIVESLLDSYGETINV